MSKYDNGSGSQEIPKSAREWKAPDTSLTPDAVIEQSQANYGDEILATEMVPEEGVVMPKGMEELSSADTSEAVAARKQYVEDLAKLYRIKDVMAIERMLPASKIWISLVEKGTDPKIAERALLKVAGVTLRDSTGDFLRRAA